MALVVIPLLAQRPRAAQHPVSGVPNVSSEHLKAGVDSRPVSSSDPPSGYSSDIPSTPHQAYCAGWDAGRRGDDLVIVVHAALCTWPMDEGLRGLAELIVCAQMGWTEGGAR
jgi:hypothetical protein